VLSAARCEDVVEALALTLALSLLPPAEPPAAVAAAAPPPVPAPRASRLALGTGLQAGRFVSDAPMLGAAVLVGLARGARAGWSLAPEGRLRFSWSRSDVALDPGRARFQLLSGALELCPLHLGAGRARAGLCGLLEAGALEGEGIGITHPRRARSAWLAVGGGPELEVALTRRWRLLGTAFVTRPLRQTRFVFADPDQPVAGTTGLALSGALAVAVHFP